MLKSCFVSIVPNDLAIHRPLQLMGGDGQVSQGSSVVKPKVRKIGDNIVVGFAGKFYMFLCKRIDILQCLYELCVVSSRTVGSTADAITLLERLEKKVEEHSNQLMRACVELAKDWRTDKFLRRLEVLNCRVSALSDYSVTSPYLLSVVNRQH